MANDLERTRDLAGEAAFTLGYARRPLQAHAQGSADLDVVAHQASMEVALGLSFRRLRLAVIFPTPVYLSGDSGSVGDRQFEAPDVTLSHRPDTIADPRLVVEGLLVGRPGGPYRLGVEATLVAPSGHREDYLSDETFRGTGKVLCAGTLGRVIYAANIGIHVRPLDEAMAGVPHGHELIGGAALGMKAMERSDGALSLGAEVFGASALKELGKSEATDLEALVGATLQQSLGQTMRLFTKLGMGTGVLHSLGAPDWRIVGSIGVTSAATGQSPR
jgi:hypothetical protein